MVEKDIEIIVTFQMSGLDRQQKKVMTKEEYYAHSDSKVEGIDSIPKHDHAYQYLQVSKKDLKSTRLQIKKGTEKIEVFETFWNDGENFFIETKRKLRGDKFHELIIQSKISAHPPTYEIIRFEKTDGETKPVFHVLDIEEDTGVREQKIFPSGRPQ